MSGERLHLQAQRLTPFAVFSGLVGLLLLVLTLPCPHGTEMARVTEPITSAAGPLGDVRSDSSCSSFSGQLTAAPRTAEGSRPDEAGAATTDTRAVDERAPWAALPGVAAVVPLTDRPHGRALLVLLGIERK